MNLNNALASTHNLKKSSYRMLKKMHTLENKGALRTCPQLNDEYYLILCLQHMSDVIKESYVNNDNAVEAVSNLESLIVSLSNTAKSRMRIDRSLLVSCLKKHTKVFNWLEDNKIKIKSDTELYELWSMKCVVAYVCQFGNRI